MGKVNHEMSAALADVIRRRREAKGMSLAKMAQEAGITQTYPGMLERGERVPTVDVAYSLAQALECQLSDLVLEAEKRMRRKKK